MREMIWNEHFHPSTSHPSLIPPSHLSCPAPTHPPNTSARQQTRTDTTLITSPRNALTTCTSAPPPFNLITYLYLLAGNGPSSHLSISPISRSTINAELPTLSFDSRGGKKLETAVRRETGESASQIWSGNKSGRGGPVDAVHEACESLSDG